jgi:hypothetical protein
MASSPMSRIRRCTRLRLTSLPCCTSQLIHWPHGPGSSGHVARRLGRKHLYAPKPVNQDASIRRGGLGRRRSAFCVHAHAGSQVQQLWRPLLRRPDISRRSARATHAQLTGRPIVQDTGVSDRSAQGLHRQERYSSLCESSISNPWGESACFQEEDEPDHAEANALRR